MPQNKQPRGLYFEVVAASTAGPVSIAPKERFPHSLGPWSLEPTIGIQPRDLEFDAGGSTWRANLPELRTSALKRHEAAILKGGLEGSGLKRVPITLSQDELAELGVPLEVTHYTWGQLSSESFRDSFSTEELHGIVAMNQPDLCFLILGGFLYFDKEGRCVTINTVVPDGSGLITFGPAKEWPSEWTEQLRASGRLTKAIRRQMLGAGASETCWISPNEDYGGKAICPHGGFVYLFPNGVQEDEAGNLELQTVLQLKNQIAAVFNRLDQNRNGRIDRAELRFVLQRIDPRGWSDERVDRLFIGMDGNLDGEVQFSEFLDWLFRPKKGQPGQASEVKENMQRVSNISVGQERVFDPVVEVATLSELLPAGMPRLCILGGRGFHNPLSKKLVEELAALCSKMLAEAVVVLTGGLPGVQETFAKALGPKPEACHLLPVGESSGFGVGRDLIAGENMEQRMAIYGHVGDIYLTIEGGPGVAKEASLAHSRGAAVLPMIWTGGASQGLFNFPSAALERPEFCSEKDWAALREVGGRGDDELVQSTSAAAVAVIAGLIKARSSR